MDLEVFDETSCGLVLYRMEEDQPLFLLLHYPAGHWDFPKGHIEEGDISEHATAARELEEETGINDLKFIEGFREIIHYEYENKGKMSKKQVIFFIGETKMESVRTSFEHQDYQWLPYDAAYNRLTYENAKNLLKKTIAKLRP